MDQKNTCYGKENGRRKRSRPSINERQHDLQSTIRNWYLHLESVGTLFTLIDCKVGQVIGATLPFTSGAWSGPQAKDFSCQERPMTSAALQPNGQSAVPQIVFWHGLI